MTFVTDGQADVDICPIEDKDEDVDDEVNRTTLLLRTEPGQKLDVRLRKFAARLDGRAEKTGQSALHLAVKNGKEVMILSFLEKYRHFLLN